MIHGTLDRWRETVANPSPRMEAAFAALERIAAAPPDDGKHEVDGDNVFVMVQRYTPRPVEQGKYEAHRKYVDIQVLVSGRERMGVLPLDGLRVETEYSDEKDVILFHRPDDNAGLQPLAAGEFMVLDPSDAHMPGIAPADGAEEVLKLVGKVRIS